MSTSIALIVETLNLALASPFLRSLFVLSTALFAFALFSFGVTLAVYAATWAWANFETEYDEGDALDTGFDEAAILTAVANQLAVAVAAIASLVSLIFSTLSTAGSGIVRNLPLFIGLAFVFVLAVLIDSWHNVVAQSLGETYSCFIAPLVRTLVLPLVNLFAIITTPFIALLNVLRQLLVSVTTETLVGSLVCSFNSVTRTVVIVYDVLRILTTETILWLQASQGAGSPFDTFPFYTTAANRIRDLFVEGDSFLQCACNSLADVALSPFIDPLRSDSFAFAIGCSLQFVPVLLAHGIARPVVRTFTNIRDSGPDDRLGDLLERPSLENPLIFARCVADESAVVGDLFLRSIFQVTVNAVSASSQGCDELDGWTAEASICREQTALDGVCNAGRCETTKVLDGGCCFTRGTNACTPAATADECPNEFRRGVSCAEVGALLGSPSTCQDSGCCVNPDPSFFGFPSTLGVACVEDTSGSLCVGGGAFFFGGQTCEAIPSCTTILSAGLPAVSIANDQECGSCASGAADGDTCQCNSCGCAYRTTSARYVAAPGFRSPVGNQTYFADCSQTDDFRENTCFADILDLSLPTGNELDALPPERGLVSAAIALSITVPFIQTPLYLSEIVFNLDRVFTDLDGYQLFQLEPVFGTILRRSANQIGFFINWLANLSRTIGANAARGTTLAVPPSQSDVLRTDTRFTVAERQELNQFYPTEGTLAQDAFDIVGDALDITANIFVNTFIPIIRYFELFLDVQIGTLYFTVRTAIEDGVPDPFAYGKILFGDTEPLATEFVCRAVGEQTGVETIAFAQLGIDDLDSAVCRGDVELLEICRLVFQRYVAQATPTPLITEPPGITFRSVGGSVADIEEEVLECIRDNLPCRVIIQPVGVVESPYPVGQLQQDLQLLVTLAQSIDDIWSTQSTRRKILENLARPIVSAVLVLIDIVVHPIELFSSSYAACLNVYGAVEDTAPVVVEFSNLIRLLQTVLPIDQRVCDTGIFARESQFGCALALGLDAFVKAITDTLTLLWVIGANFYRAFFGQREFVEILRLFDISFLVGSFEAGAFAVVSIGAQVIPNTVLCTDEALPGPTRGCCKYRTIVRPFNRFGRTNQAWLVQTGQSTDQGLVTEYNNIADTNRPAVFPLCVPNVGALECVDIVERDSNFFPLLDHIFLQILEVGQKCDLDECANGYVFDDMWDGRQKDALGAFVWEQGCCQTLGRTKGGPFDQVLSCVDQEFDFRCDTDRNRFIRNADCDSVPTCPDRGRPVQTVVSDFASQSLTDVIFFLPLILQDLYYRLLDFILALPSVPSDIVSEIVTLVLRPVLEVVINIILRLQVLFDCAGLREISVVLSRFGVILQVVSEIGINIVVLLIEIATFTFIGLFELVLFFSFTFIGRAVSVLLELVSFIIFALFGTSFLCTLQDFACAVVDDAGPLVPGTSADVALFTNQCRLYDCCASPIAFDGDLSLVSSCSNTNPCTAFDCDDLFVRTTSAEAVRLNITTAREHYEALRLARRTSEAPSGADVRQYPSEAFCGGFVAQLGGVAAARSSADETAQRCAELLDVTSVNATTAMDAQAQTFANGLRAYMRPVTDAAVTMQDAVLAHFRMHTDLAFARHEERVMTSFFSPRHSHVEQLMQKYHQVELKKHHERTVAEKDQYHAARRRVFREHGMVLADHMMQHVFRGVVAVHSAFVTHKEHHKLGEFIMAHFVTPPANGSYANSTVLNPLRFRLQDSALMSATKRYVASFSVALGYLRTKRDALSRNVAAVLRAPFAIGEAREARAARARRSRKRRDAQRVAAGRVYERRFGERRAPVFTANGTEIISPPDLVGDPILDALTLGECDDSTRALPCTDCLLLDNLFFAGEDALNSTVDFYGTPGAGYQLYLAQSDRYFNETVVAPFGSDVYTETDPAIPFVLKRLRTINWFWQWNYTVLTELFDDPASTSSPAGEPVDFEQFVGATEQRQRDLAAAAGRDDFDLVIFDAFDGILSPLFAVGERFLGGASATSATTAFERVFERFVACDYSGALQCRSELLGVGLFDGVANTLLITFGVGVLLTAALPSFPGYLVSLALVPFFYYIVLWISYGASPLCTTPTQLFMIPGIPTCVLIDAYELLHETFPQCPPTIEPSLIEPSAFAEASETLCASCGTSPPLRHCSDFGFFDGFDNLFYTTTSVFDESVTTFVAAPLAAISPTIGSIAAQYTNAYVASLGDAGVACNMYTFLNIVTAFAGVVLFLVTLAGATGLVLAYNLLAFYLWPLTVYVCNAMFEQIDRGFVQGTRVRKLGGI